MKNQFIVLTTTENTEIIIGISHIVSIKQSEGNPNFTAIRFNLTVGKSFEAAKIDVKENYTTVKSMIGL